jgi:competence protein ComGC
MRKFTLKYFLAVKLFNFFYKKMSTFKLVAVSIILIIILVSMMPRAPKSVTQVAKDVADGATDGVAKTVETAKDTFMGYRSRLTRS